MVQSVATFRLLMANIACAKSPSMIIFLSPLFAPSVIAISVANASPILEFVLWMISVYAKTGVTFLDLHIDAIMLSFCLTTTSNERKKTLVGGGCQGGSC